MNIRIDIECESISDFHSHLSEIKRQIRKETKRLKLTPSDEFESNKEQDYTISPDLDDNNCYGNHEVTILNDE